MYIYCFLFFVTAYDDSRFKRYKILFQLRNSQLTKSRNVLMLQTTKTHALKGWLVFILDLRSIIGCPGGICWGIYAPFSCKKRTSLFISRQKVIIITSKQGTTTFFFFIKIFF